MKFKSAIRDLIAAVSVSAICSISFADQPPSKTDTEAFQKLQKIVSGRSDFFKGMSATLPGEAAFCKQFMRDLKNSKRIQIYEPYYRTNNLDDPELKPWRECGEDTNISEGLRWYPSTGTSGFRLYKVDADNNPRNGLEDVMYSEWDPKEVNGPAGFHWWDLKSCQSRGGASAQQDDGRDANGKGTLGDNYALLIRYDNKTWALAMEAMSRHLMKGWDDKWMPPENYYLILSSLHRKPEQPRRTHYSCSWSTIQIPVPDSPTQKPAQ